MTQTLYNLRHDGEQYRVTKFVDGEVEASYLTTHTECDCPAGFRPTCRHRQMLPDLLSIADTHWFLNNGTREVVDLIGTPKSTIDALIAPIKEDTSMTAACPPGCCAPAEQDTAEDTVPTGLPAVTLPLPPASWRRL